jgi:hypothetical protein
MPPTDPPRDVAGNVVPHDHPDILNQHHVIRHTTPRDLVVDADSRKSRIASGAYSESSEGGMSVDMEEWMIRDTLDILTYVVDQSHGATRLNVGELRRLGFTVGWDPQPHNPHHCAVWGIGNGSSRKRKIAKIAVTIRKALGES